tara:strand:+ start:1122 stop:1988 length:867 start_codon:yes stop_codon:yes gene_type:complete
MKKTRLKIKGLKVPPAIMLFHLSKDLEINKKFDVSFDLWPDAMSMRKDLASSNVDLCIMPTNLSSSFYNQGYPIKLLSVNVWGILYILSSETHQSPWRLVEQNRIAIPLKGNMPDTIFNILAKKQGIKNVDIKYLDTYQDALNELINSKVKLVVLPEPYASIAELNGKSRLINFQEVWKNIFNESNGYPQAGVVVNSAFSDSEAIILNNTLKNSLNWMVNHSFEASQIGSEILKQDALAIKKSIKSINWNYLDASSARGKIESFLSIIAESTEDSNSIVLPDNEFYLL